MADQNYWADFTNLYALSKTLRFELKPVGPTLDHMKANDILMHDEQRAAAYQEIKPLFDDLHAEFITDSLSATAIDWTTYFEVYQRFRREQDKGQKRAIQKEINGIEKDLRSLVTKYFSTTADTWKLRHNSSHEKPVLLDKSFKILTENGILKVLAEKHKDEPDHLAAIKLFEGFFTYFTGFNQNRENYYSADEETTAVSHRIVNENLPIFCSNILQHQKYTAPLGFVTDASIFTLGEHNSVLVQTGIDGYNKQIGELNKTINLHNQQHPGEKRIPQFKTLHKQIGGKVSKESLFIVIDEKDYTLEQALHEFIEQSTAKNQQIVELIRTLSSKSDLSQIYLNRKALNTISNKFFSEGTWHLLADRLRDAGIFHLDKKTGDLKQPDFIPLSDIQTVLDAQTGGPSTLFKKTFEQHFRSATNSSILIKILQGEFQTNAELFKVSAAELQKLLSEKLDKNNEKHKETVKNFADRALTLLQMVRYFVVKEGKVSGTDSDFYETLKNILEDYRCSGWYDAIRNYLTQKPYSTQKMKLNFGCSTLCGGWDLNKESSNLAIMLVDPNGSHFLAIARKDANFVFDKRKNPALFATSEGTETWQKMEYKLLPGPNKMLPKVFFAKKNMISSDNPKGLFHIPDRVLDIRERESFKKGDSFDRDDLNAWIDFCKENIDRYPDWKVFDFHFLPSEQYADVSRFYNHVEKQGYRLDFVGVNKKTLSQMVTEGKVYLFQIANKDLTNTTTAEQGKKQNIHTMIWKTLFEDKTSTIKLNGEAELFFRPASLEKREPVTGQNSKQTINHAIKNKRYTEDKFLFHVPITLNFSLHDERINEKINAHINSSGNLHIIGIDRGEKHLAYYSVVDLNGHIVEQGTLNQDLLGKDYAAKLDEVAGNRTEARKNWQTIGTIKELKEGYISQVVRRIADLVLKYNALVVLEDLNIGFKRGRQKIEKSVYQKLELALAKKFNFLVQKDALSGKAGSVTRALQLTPPTNTFGDIRGKQWGIMLYTRAAYTSVTDPVTGFRKNIYLRKGAKEDMRDAILSFREIGFDPGKEAYYFSYDPADFAENKSLSRLWTMFSCVSRIRSEKDEHGIWVPREVDVTSNLNRLFTSHGIITRSPILPQIKNRAELDNKFYEELIWNINLILQLRNSNSAKGEDFIHSPVVPFFDSRVYEQEGRQPNGIDNTNMPTCGDANGAYNIARKGLMMVERIKTNMEKPDLYIPDEEWDAFSQKQTGR